MAQKIHINTARAIMDSGDRMDLAIWTKSGSIERMRDCVGLRWSRRTGCRQIKLLQSNEIRTIRDVCVFMVNGMEVFL